ncbi:hypothetical protein LCGC14_2987780 [marine sediment metagenome]|uniref:Uncharacterized protein n=1 Tax=marine sediment metagenome TaxID=412755 RepID=A0A0F8X4R2_9ZZZZ
MAKEFKKKWESAYQVVKIEGGWMIFTGVIAG